MTYLTNNLNSGSGMMRYRGMESHPDNGNVNVNSSNAYFPKLGGNYNNDDNCGLFYVNVNNNSTNSNSNYGSRLASVSRSSLYMRNDWRRNPRDHGSCQNTKTTIHTSVRWYSRKGAGRRTYQ